MLHALGIFHFLGQRREKSISISLVRNFLSLLVGQTCAGQPRPPVLALPASERTLLEGVRGQGETESVLCHQQRLLVNVCQPYLFKSHLLNKQPFPGGISSKEAA